MESTSRCIIVGASHAAAQLAPALRQQGWTGAINMISNEYFLPYHRPLLSKDFLTGAKNLESIMIRPAAAYQKANIRITMGVSATSIDRANKRLTRDDG